MSTINLIHKIIDFHPGSDAGRKRGWSNYVGGMTDSGDWDFRKLLKASEEELEECLKDLILEHLPPPPLSQEDQDLQSQLIITDYGCTNALEHKLRENIFNEMEKTLLWGTFKKDPNASY